MSSVGKPAFVEEVDGNSDENRTVRASRQSASLRDKDKNKKASREDRPRREKKSRSDDGTIRVPKEADEATTVDNIRVIPDPREVRRKSTVSSSKDKGHRKSQSRPAPTTRGVTFDAASSRPHKDDPRYFGRGGDENVVVLPSRSRPPLAMPSHTRPARPTSFHAPRPPLSNSASFQPSPLYRAGVPIPPSPVMIAAPMIPAAYGYFDPRTASPRSGSGLAERFHRTRNFPRPASSAGYRDAEPRRAIEYYDDEEEDGYDLEEERERERQDRLREQHDREKEIRRREKAVREREKELREKEARESMPPPALPDMRRRMSIRTKAPPSIDYPTFPDARERMHESRRRSRDFIPRSYTEDELKLNQPRITYRETEPTMKERRQSMSRAPNSDNSFDFARGDPDIRVEGRGGRRSSFYKANSGITGISGGSSDWEDKERMAMGYQKEVSGDPPKLTADLLKKQQRTIASSRSTRSSGSRDESDIRQSVTTRTTRSGSGTEANTGEYTIQIKGNATLNIPGGGTLTTDGEPVELTIRGHPGQRAIRNGSEASRSEYAPSVPSAMSANEERMREKRRSRHGRNSYHGTPMSEHPSIRERRYGMPGDYGEYF